MRTSRSGTAKGSEAHLVGGLVRFLTDEGYRVRLEVPNMGQSADLVASRSRWLTFVEAKRHDWRRALEQCQAHEAVADYICVAISLHSVSNTLLEEAKDAGYGLILCDLDSRTCKWVLQPSRNTKVWPPQRRRLMAAMKAIDYAD